MMKKKRPFILLELFLALALVTIFSLPLIQAQAFYVKRVHRELLELELQRKAEEMFFHICETLTDDHPLHEISGQWKKNPHPLNAEIVIDLGPLVREKIYKCHYHIHSSTSKKLPFRKLICQVCFSGPFIEKSCQAHHSFEKMVRPFHLTIE